MWWGFEIVQMVGLTPKAKKCNLAILLLETTSLELSDGYRLYLIESIPKWWGLTIEQMERLAPWAKEVGPKIIYNLEMVEIPPGPLV